MESSERRRPLEGVRVCDLSHQAAGPWCTTLLGDLGADVIKVEKPGRGDGIRYAGDVGFEIGSYNFQGLNRNKRSCTIDLQTPRGRDLIERLALASDVLVENFRPGVLDRHGLGYEALAAKNPRLVYCSITAFGPRGPLAQAPGMDLILQARSGLMGLTGEPGGPPIKAAPPVADITSAIYAAYGILAALLERERSGRGQRVDLGMLDAVVSMFGDIAANILTLGTHYEPFGTGHPDICPYQAFRASDGWFILACFTNAFWKRYAAAMGRTDLLEDPRFRTNRDRVVRKQEFIPLLQAELEKRPRAHWLALAERVDVPACAVERLEDVLESPQLRTMESVVEREHPKLGRIRIFGPPVRFSATPSRVDRLAPMLGADTTGVLRDLGLPDHEIEDLRAGGVIGG
jgi:crotonobetainyl-CoA:carnitine CoA-transferase CaiB-like acyl-CoA transferase